MATAESKPASTALRVGTALAAVGLSVWLVWSLRSLILPVAVGSLLAYVCQPLVAALERFRLPRGLTVALLVAAMIVIGLFLLGRVRAALPAEVGALEMRVRAFHNINQRYRALMDLDDSLKGGNRVYRFAGEDLDPLIDQVDRSIALTPEERARFLASRSESPDARADRLIDYDLENQRTLETRGLTVVKPPRIPRGASATQRTKGPLARLGAALSTWIVAPAVFFFLLRDGSRIKRGFLGAVPNRLFEPTLAVFADLDRALGGYVRGIFLESCFLGVSVGLLLRVLGAPIGWAILVGLIAGAANPVPYIGSAVALLGGLSFIIAADEVHPLLPTIRSENAAIWLVVGVVLIEVLKNSVFEPFVLGESVDVHPLVIFIGVLAGGLLFGAAGLLLALPTITLLKTLVASVSHQLKAYGLI
jgi:predicted PurR-regulated permease PerM